MIDFLKNLFHPLFDPLAATLMTFHAWGVPWWLSVTKVGPKPKSEAGYKLSQGSRRELSSPPSFPSLDRIETRKPSARQ